MRVILAQPRASVQAWSAPSRSSSGRSRSSGAPVYVRPRSGTTPCRRAARAHGAVSSTSWTRPGRRGHDLMPMAWPNRSSDEARTRGLPVLDATCPLVSKVPPPGQALRGARPGADPDRPCRPSRGRRDHGAGRRARSIVSTVEDVAALDCRRCAHRLRHPDHPQRRRHAPGVIAALQARFSDLEGPDVSSDICCHAASPVGGPRSLHGADLLLGVWAAATARTPTGCAKSASNRGCRATHR